MEQQNIYDLVIIGGGSGGLSAMGMAIETGASVALIEKHRLGGDLHLEAGVYPASRCSRLRR